MIECTNEQHYTWWRNGGGVKERRMNTNKIGFLMLALLAGGASSLPAFAVSGGEVANLSGTLSAQRPDGALLILSQKSEVRPGDTLTTQKDSYAQINFPDGSSMTMRPNTRMKVENFQFSQDKPQEDGAFFRLIKGGLRTITGLVGKRGNQDAYRISTATATIGIRGSSGNTLVCDPSCAGVVSGGEKLPQGTYHETNTGSYIMVVGPKTEEITEGRSGWTDGLSLNVGPTSTSPLGGVVFPIPGFFSGPTANLCN
jgi:hypothetical protein